MVVETVAGIIAIFISDLVIRIIVLTFVVGVPDVSFINLNLLGLILAVADINVVDLIDPSSVDLLLGQDMWFKVQSLSHGCFQHQGHFLVEPPLHFITKLSIQRVDSGDTGSVIIDFLNQ